MIKITSCLIGEDSLLIQCGNSLRRRGHIVAAVVSSTQKIQAWAQHNHITCFEQVSDFLAGDSHFQFDYIFSIVNSYILPDTFLKHAKHGAINYHDSFLPRYAGLNATSWAILNEEKDHGVTWHLMNDKIDQGDIVKQQRFPIFSRDTAFLLNLRCYEAAIKSFRELLTDIEKNNLFPKPQNLANQTYYHSNHELPNLGFIDWENFSAEQINNLWRALALGHSSNHLGTLKLYIENEYFIVQKVEMEEFENTIPGKIISIENEALYVSTTTKNIKITELCTPVGIKISVKEFVKKFHITAGYQLPLLDISLIQELYTRSLQNEKFWIKELIKLSEHTLFLDKGKDPLTISNISSVQINLKKIFPNKKITSVKNILITSILIYLYRLNNHTPTSVFFTQASCGQIYKNCGQFLSAFFPFTFLPSFKMSLKEAQLFIQENLSECAEKGTYPTDLISRHPALEENTYAPSIIINYTEEFDFSILPASCRLFFQVNEQEGTISIYHNMDSSVAYSKNEITNNMTQHVTNILINVVNNSHIPLTHFCFLQEHERYKMLKVWGQGPQVLLAHTSIINNFEKQFETNPNKIALIMEERSVSYKELWEASEKICRFIVNEHSHEEKMIGIYFDRGIEMLAVILGVLKSNNTYVPLDTKYPITRIQYIIDETNMCGLFTQTKYLSKLSDCFEKTKSLNLINTDDILEAPLPTSNLSLKKRSYIDNRLCYVMFTSGSTGHPKGVMVTEENVLNYCHWFLKSTQFNSESIMDFSSSIAFDLSIPCTIAPLLVGGTIAICPQNQKTNPEYYLTHLKKNCISHIEITPGYLHLALEYPDHIKQLTELKWVLLGAETVIKTDVLKWLTLCPHHHLINEYGPTETTVAVTSYLIDPVTLPAESTVPIGIPGYNSQCYILDKYKNLCPLGMPGELYIGGKQITKGYLNQLSLTQENFILSQINKPKEILYKTGDIACWSSEGNLQFLGRNDNQVKIQGYRIETSEIESYLASLPGIKQALVTVQDEKFMNKYLRAHLVCEQNFIFDDEIRKLLADYFPPYMIPKEFCLVDMIPLKENEKIDYHALKNLKAVYLTSQTKKSLEEHTSFQEDILHIWQTIFNSNLITVHDDFFDIGGDSLIGLQIIDEMQHAFNTNIQLRYLFEYPTVALLASKVYELYQIKKSFSDKSYVASPTCIIKLSKDNPGPPLFLIHPVGGTIFWYTQLVFLLKEKYTIYGIQDPNIDEVKVPFNSIEDMANYYITMIESIHHGKYYLGGASFGATVAFEMAHQLTMNGNRPLFLGLFDGWGHYPDILMQKYSSDFLNNNALYHQDLGKERKKKLIALEDHRKKLLLNYKLPFLDMDVTLFKAMELWPAFQAIENTYNGWQPYVKNSIQVYKTPGNHETMFFDPHIKTLANLVDDRLLSVLHEIEAYQ